MWTADGMWSIETKIRFFFGLTLDAPENTAFAIKFDIFVNSDYFINIAFIFFQRLLHLVNMLGMYAH